MWGTEIYSSGATKIGNSLDAVCVFSPPPPPRICRRLRRRRCSA
jgi:hypothetical protein